jgi:hypothetical protein
VLWNSFCLGQLFLPLPESAKKTTHFWHQQPVRATSIPVDNFEQNSDRAFYSSFIITSFLPSTEAAEDCIPEYPSQIRKVIICEICCSIFPLQFQFVLRFRQLDLFITEIAIIRF